MFPRKRNFLIFLVIAAIYSAATGLDLDKKDGKEDIISQNDDSREEPDFCAEVCGEEYGVVCIGDKSDKSKIKCTCLYFNEVFDENDKECKVDYCKEKCGNVKCQGNRFKEYEVECICNNKDEDFIEDEKRCKVNYCRKICGTGKNIVCDGDEYEPRTSKNCECDDDEYLFINKKCQKKCSDDEDCFNEGKCKGEEGSKLCQCKRGTTGDRCERITECETGKLKNCKEDRGKCVYRDGKAVCWCEYGKMFHEKLGYCEAACNDDSDCEGYNRKCIDSFCMCRDGFEGEDCSVITGCKDLEEKCRNISTICVFKENAPGKAICKCKTFYTYNFETNQCEDPYCYPENPCKEGECRYDDSVGTGYCVCPGEKYYNYRKQRCEALPDKCILKKTPCDETEICVNGKCRCKHPTKEGEKCKSNFCSSNLCFPNSICSEHDRNCYCGEGKYYNGVKCQDAPCNFKEFKKSCPCPPGMFRQNAGDECLPKDGEELCSKDCGYGICVEKNNRQSCRCFSSIAANSKYYGTCSIKERMFCASKNPWYDLMRCKCDGQFTQADDGITCRLKTCEDDDVQKDCASKGGVCKMNWKGNGYYCECPLGYGKDDNGKCTDVCSLEKVIKTCAKEDKFCYNSVSSSNQLTGICNCPPTLKMVNGRCSEKARYVHMIRNIPVLKKRYELKSGINKVLLNADLIRSMEKTFDESLFEYGYLYDYRIEGDVIRCSVWVNFKRLPWIAEENRLKLVPKNFPNICDDCDENAIVWPPNVILGENGLQNVKVEILEFCSPEVKDILCGKGASCKDEKCTCGDGFKVIEYSFREIAGYSIQRCEDIDECAIGFHICSENTTCVNTFGGYKCACKEGFQKEQRLDDPEYDKRSCFDMCTPSPCGKGKCHIIGNLFDCECEPGFGGPFCDRADATCVSSNTDAMLVGSVLGVLLIVLAAAFFCYVIKMKRRSHSDDIAPSSRQNHSEMIERRPM